MDLSVRNGPIRPGLRVRRRSSTTPLPRGTSGIRYYGQPLADYPSKTDAAFGTHEETFDVSTPNWRKIIKAGGNPGHDFLSLKVSISPPAFYDINRGQQWNRDYWTKDYIVPTQTDKNLYTGLFSPNKKDWEFFAKDAGLSDLQLSAFGSRAIARTIPNDPSVSIAQTLGELREGLPNLTIGALRRGDLGGEFLNYKFGIAPLLSDYQNYVNAVHNSQKALAQWKRDSGRHVRRRYSFPEVKTSTVSTLSNQYPIAMGTMLDNYQVRTGTLTTTTTMERQVWFSGAYKYFVPPSVDNFLDSLRDFDHLYGLRLTPEVAWELTPWSWLVDWHVNAGDVLHNISAMGRDCLSLLYGFIMSHTTHIVHRRWEGQFCYNGTWKPATVESTIITDVKQRQVANPFGVGWLTEDYSDSQLAILSALGLTKLKR